MQAELGPAEGLSPWLAKGCTRVALSPVLLAEALGVSSSKGSSQSELGSHPNSLILT